MREARLRLVWAWQVVPSLCKLHGHGEDDWRAGERERRFSILLDLVHGVGFYHVQDSKETKARIVLSKCVLALDIVRATHRDRKRGKQCVQGHVFGLDVD